MEPECSLCVYMCIWMCALRGDGGWGVDEEDSLFLVLVLGGLVDLHRTAQLDLFWH